MTFPAEIVLKVGQTERLMLVSRASAGYLWQVATSGACLDAALPLETELPANPPSLPSIQVGGDGEQALLIRGVSEGDGQVVIELRRPWLAEDPTAERYTILVRVELDDSPRIERAARPHPLPEKRAGAEVIPPFAPVSDAEVRAALDQVDGKRPYGSAKFSATRTALTIVAEDIAVIGGYGLAYELPSWKVRGFVKTFTPEALVSPSLEFSAQRALREFARGRGARFERESER